MTYNWTIYPKNSLPEEVLALSQGDSLLARLLMNRNVHSKDLAQYFLDLENVIPSDAYEIPELDKAIARINKAITAKEKITIYGDYDVDGTSSTALLIRAFAMIGIAVDYYIPSRHTEGYGLNIDAIQKIYQEKKSTLLITCDCGISNYAEVEFANSIGLDVIITDHHSIPKLTPPSIANCNPKTLDPLHPLHYLPGVGVAYKLAEKLLELHIPDPLVAKAHAESLLDLVALGMIADMASLRAENRYLTIRGLSVLSKTTKVGLRELLFTSGVNGKADSEHIGFGLAPRINAAGRLADAAKAVELMITEDQDYAQELCSDLDSGNRERQVLCQKIIAHALEKLQNDSGFQNHNCIVVSDRDWHHGVIGIVASKLLDTFHLPVFIMSIENDSARGSVRSINLSDLDIFEEMQAIQNKAGLFTKFGGHKMAAGFSCKSSDVEALTTAIKDHFKTKLAEANLIKKVKIDTALKLTEVNSRLLDRIAKLAPYGIDNPQPLFLVGPVIVDRIKILGKDQKHLKLFIKDIDGKRSYEAVLWNRAEEFLAKYPLLTKPELCIVFSAKLNEFNGEVSIQLDIKDWKDTDQVDDSFFARFKAMEAHLRN